MTIPPQDLTEAPDAGAAPAAPCDLLDWQEFWLTLAADYETILVELDLAA